MKQFFETYRDHPELSPLVRAVSWTNNLLIFSRCSTLEEKHYYLTMCQLEGYSKRELDRQITSGYFERSQVTQKLVSPAAREIHPHFERAFKDDYVFEFLGLPEGHSERDLQRGLVTHMKNFLLEMGSDFLFIGQEYKLQVGNSDFYVDLLLYHRGLQCLVAIELKIEKFRSDHIGQLNFYLEALDRNVKKPAENPTIGVLLCTDKDNEVVEYALSRSVSPTLVAQYKTHLPDKETLQRKFRELCMELADPEKLHPKDLPENPRDKYD